MLTIEQIRKRISDFQLGLIAGYHEKVGQLSLASALYEEHRDIEFINKLWKEVQVSDAIPLGLEEFQHLCAISKMKREPKSWNTNLPEIYAVWGGGKYFFERFLQGELRGYPLEGIKGMGIQIYPFTKQENIFQDSPFFIRAKYFARERALRWGDRPEVVILKAPGEVVLEATNSRYEANIDGKNYQDVQVLEIIELEHDIGQMPAYLAKFYKEEIAPRIQQHHEERV